MPEIRNILPGLLSVIMLFGCAGHPASRSDIPADAWPDIREQQQMSWWQVQFIKQWPADSPAPFHHDLMLAEQVIRPVLERNKDTIKLWRFHRRAARDHAGSKFSFIFYASAEDAKAITGLITTDPLVTELADKKYIEEIWIDDFTKIKRPKISDTSDPVWPLEIQNSWPYFIMGVSQSWLALIDEFTSARPLDVRTASVEDIVDYYTGVSIDLDNYWKDNGGHAYIHHLSALFGYRPVEMRF